MSHFFKSGTGKYAAGLLFALASSQPSAQGLTYDKVMPSFNLEALTQIDSAITNSLLALERVPDSLQEIVNSHGITAFFVENFADHPAYETIVRENAQNALGVYLSPNIIVRRDPRTLDEKESNVTRDRAIPYVTLHEYGHAVGRIIRGTDNIPIFLNDSFARAYMESQGINEAKQELPSGVNIDQEIQDLLEELDNLKKQLQLAEIKRNHADKMDQFFADSFALYYLGDTVLRQESPKTYDFFRQLEMDLASGKYSHLLEKKN